jgi:hypothetical protein
MPATRTAHHRMVRETFKKVNKLAAMAVNGLEVAM